MPSDKIPHIKTVVIFLSVFISILFPHLMAVHSLSFNITSFNQNQPLILLEGDARIASGAIQLNMDYYYRVGRVQHSEPFQLWDSVRGTRSSFDTRFSFTIDTSGRDATGDGLVFFLAPPNYPIPPNSAGGGYGLLNATTSLTPSLNRIVMVEFDTFPNTEAADPPQQHVGINRNSVESIAYKPWNASRHSGEPASVRIAYNATAKNLTVSWTYNQHNDANESLSSILDLKEVLPENVSIGFAAATGLFYETHAVNSWAFSSSVDGTEIDRVLENEPTDHKKPRTMINKLVLAVVIPVLAVIFLVGTIVVYRRFVVTGKKLSKSRKVAKIELETASLPRRFSYQELLSATNGFADDMRLGRGGSGQVYRGTLTDSGGRTIAVKRIFGEAEPSEKVFTNEVKIISRLIHRNLVKFIGWCHEKSEYLLVYDFMPNGSLDAHLFRRGGEARAALPWDARYGIALGLASALHYLHEEAEQCVLHRDIKSANILLDTDFSAKLGDFGVSKLIDTVDARARTDQRTGLVGTFGYLAPEYVSQGRASKESDMYSFGVVALEIACGRRTFRESDGSHVPLMRWVWELYVEGKVMEAADERLGREFDGTEMRRLLMVGLWCSHLRVERRPKAGQVIKLLRDFDTPLPELPRDMHGLNIVVDDDTQPEHQRLASHSLGHTAITSSITNVGR